MIDNFKIMTYNMSCTFALPEITVSSIDWLSPSLLMRHIRFRKKLARDILAKRKSGSDRSDSAISSSSRTWGIVFLVLYSTVHDI